MSHQLLIFNNFLCPFALLLSSAGRQPDRQSSSSAFSKSFKQTPQNCRPPTCDTPKKWWSLLVCSRASSCKMAGAAVGAFFRALLVQVKGFIIQIHSTNGKGGQFSDPDTLKSFCQKKSCFFNNFIVYGWNHLPSSLMS